VLLLVRMMGGAAGLQWRQLLELHGIVRVAWQCCVCLVADSCIGKY
jgi:ABC-type cobalamin transport system permease subunit